MASANAQQTAPGSAPPSPKRAAQNIIVLCDGTWQSRRDLIIHGARDKKQLTNVALLAQAIAPYAAVPDSCGCTRRNVVAYLSGVGTTLDEFSHLFQGGTGAGLDKKVEDAYMFLCDNWQPGDDIFLFGFSRGAYTARCVGGLINWAGILQKRELTHFPEVWEAYSDSDPSDAATDEAAAQLFFKRFGRWPNREASDVASAAAPQGDATATAPAGAPTVRPPPIRVLGVWDTVGALGVPGSFGNAELTRRWSFYDPGLGSSVQHAFHALALDEDRKDFLPTLWYQQPRAASAPPQELKQVWFPGAHSDVGGGWGFHGLSDVTLAWMVAQLYDCAAARAQGGPLLNVDLQRVRELQDRRARWAAQPPHPSRPSVALQATRHVGGPPALLLSPSQLERVTWRSMLVTGRRCEALHASVVACGRFERETSAQFAALRETQEGRERLEQMWKDASAEDALSETEKALRWEHGTDFYDDGHVRPLQKAVDGEAGGSGANNDNGDGNSEAHTHADETLAARLVDALLEAAVVPSALLAAAVNRRVGTPRDNLRPGLLAMGVEALRARVGGGTAKEDLRQQVQSEAT